MLQYNPDKLLVSIHIPKCAGTSFTTCLRSVFKDRLFLHYPDDPEGPPERAAAQQNACVHGHFYHHQWAIGALDYYPDATQFITMLRDPMEMVLSGYYFRRRLGDLGQIDVEKYLEDTLKNPKIFNYLGLPFDLWSASEQHIQAWLEQRFLWIGLTERFADSLELLAVKLGKPTPSIPFENTSPREENIIDLAHYREQFRVRFHREFALYDYASRRLDWELDKS